MALFVGRIPRDLNNPRDLEDLFAKYGKIIRLDVKKGFGFVEYEDIRDAEDAMKELNDQGELVIEWAKNGGKRPNENECFHCGKEGHWARDCQEAPNSDGRGPGGGYRPTERGGPVGRGGMGGGYGRDRSPRRDDRRVMDRGGDRRDFRGRDDRGRDRSPPRRTTDYRDNNRFDKRPGGYNNQGPDRRDFRGSSNNDYRVGGGGGGNDYRGNDYRGNNDYRSSGGNNDYRGGGNNDYRGGNNDYRSGPPAGNMGGGYNDVGNRDYRSSGPMDGGYRNNAAAAPDYRSNVPDYRSNLPPPQQQQYGQQGPPPMMGANNIVGNIAGTSAIERGPDRRGEIRLPVMPMQQMMPMPPQQSQAPQQPPQYD